jgi:hypothetical protein
MGTVELSDPGTLLIHSHLIIYGNAATESITSLLREEIETMWNEPQGTVLLDDQFMTVTFRITAAYKPEIADQEIIANMDPRNNYFRIEEYVMGNISFVDGLGCNTGYFKLDNLYKGSTTAAHEYGHTLGLEHPRDLDIRGEGVPGIMYPRGTLVDAQFQYNPAGRAGDSNNGGTMNPIHRRVRQQDVELLNLHRLDYNNGTAVLGEFSSVWHGEHRTI